MILKFATFFEDEQSISTGESPTGYEDCAFFSTRAKYLGWLKTEPGKEWAARRLAWEQGEAKP